MASIKAESCVATALLNHLPVTLIEVAEALFGQYKQKVFPAVVIRCRQSRAAVFIFLSRKIVCVGANDVQHALMTIHLVVHRLAKAFPDYPWFYINFTVHNLVGSVNMHYSLDLAKMNNDCDLTRAYTQTEPTWECVGGKVKYEDDTEAGFSGLHWKTGAWWLLDRKPKTWTDDERRLAARHPPIVFALFTKKMYQQEPDPDNPGCMRDVRAYEIEAGTQREMKEKGKRRIPTGQVCISKGLVTGLKNESFIPIARKRLRYLIKYKLNVTQEEIDREKMDMLTFEIPQIDFKPCEQNIAELEDEMFHAMEMNIEIDDYKLDLDLEDSDSDE
jgi:TATA-box binding protein (TBP) (component of TFIID and TFIIIB)